MSTFLFNSSEVSNIYFNGQEVKTIILNGTTAWSSLERVNASRIEAISNLKEVFYFYTNNTDSESIENSSFIPVQKSVKIQGTNNSTIEQAYFVITKDCYAKVVKDAIIDIFCIGGGGGGGGYPCGSGGGGGYQARREAFPVFKDEIYQIIIGQGGDGGTSSSPNGKNGTLTLMKIISNRDSSASNYSNNDITSTNPYVIVGYGGFGGESGYSKAGGAGGCGGGGSGMKGTFNSSGRTGGSGGTCLSNGSSALLGGGAGGKGQLVTYPNKTDTARPYHRWIIQDSENDSEIDTAAFDLKNYGGGGGGSRGLDSSSSTNSSINGSGGIFGGGASDNPGMDAVAHSGGGGGGAAAPQDISLILPSKMAGGDGGSGLLMIKLNNSTATT